jgi:hypothetical protein
MVYAQVTEPFFARALETIASASCSAGTKCRTHFSAV